MTRRKKKKVRCPRCGKSDRLERNCTISSVLADVSGGLAGTFSYLNLGLTISPIVPKIPNIPGPLVEGLLGREYGRKVGEEIQRVLKNEYRCQRCKIKFKR